MAASLPPRKRILIGPNVDYTDMRADLSDVASSVDLESLIHPAKSEPLPTMNHGSACV
jgi:hypothetical protein